MTSDAHFLHEKNGLEAVLSPPLERPRAMDWVGTTTRLIVATDDGELVEVDPVFGTRQLRGTVQDIAALVIAPNGKRMAIVERGQRIALHSVGNGERVAELACPLISDIAVAWFRNKGALALVACGNTIDGRRAFILDEEFTRSRVVKLPAGAVLGPGKEGRLLLARCSPTGLDVVPVGRKLAQTEATSHRLRFGPQGLILGVTAGGVTCWRGPKDPAHTVAMLDVTAAAVSPDGQRLALGTRNGQVAMAQVDGDQLERGRPGKVGGHSEAVRQMSFAINRGNWLATIADRLRIWKY